MNSGERFKKSCSRKGQGATVFGLCVVAVILAVAIGFFVIEDKKASPAESAAPVVYAPTLIAPKTTSTPTNPPAPQPVAAAPAKTDSNTAAPKHEPAWPELGAGAVRNDDAEKVTIERALLVTDGLEDGKLPLIMNKSAILSTRAAYKRVSVGSPDIADVNTIGPTNILVTAKKPGTTQLIIWDDAERSQVVDLAVGIDLPALQEQFKQQFPGSKIDLSMANGQLVLRGRVPSLIVAEQAVQLATPYSPKVLNFLEISGGQQVMLQVRFAEVSRSATSQLGFNFGSTDGRSFLGNNIGQVSPLGIVDSAGAASGVKLAIQSPNPAVTLFGTGLVGDSAFAYYIAALRQNNLLRILAEPNLTAMSGQEASFLAGGEFPVPVTQGGGTGAGGTAVTVEYRSFGVKLRFTPVVLGDGKIRLKVAPEVSDLDFTTAVRFNGFVIPGLTQRKLETSIELKEGQTFAVAGLLNNNVSATKDVTPVLGDIPYLGALFRSVRYQRKETELVVIVTPRLVEGMNPAQVPLLPGEKWRHPSEADLFWQRDIGSPGGDPRKAATPANATPTADGEAPRFKGQFGYVPADGDEE